MSTFRRLRSNAVGQLSKQGIFYSKWSTYSCISAVEEPKSQVKKYYLLQTIIFKYQMRFDSLSHLISSLTIINYEIYGQIIH